MDLKKYGWDDFFQQKYAELKTELVPGRIIAQLSNMVRVASQQGEFLAELSGRLKYTTSCRSELPVIGDWVLCIRPEKGDNGIIDIVLPRKSAFLRKKAGTEKAPQVVAANIDFACIVSSLDSNFNLSRIERYLTLAHEGNCSPILIFNKSDLCTAEEIEDKKELVKKIAGDAPSLFLSAKEKSGFNELKKIMQPGTTASFIGSSGVGKSTILNILAEEEYFKTTEVREKDSKGRHTTSHKEMLILSSGAIVIDTPGMREVGLWSGEQGIEDSFPDIQNLATNCKFRDCSHQNEPACAVRSAVEKGEIAEERYLNYIKQRQELDEIEEKKKRQQAGNSKKRWKPISKEIKRYKKKFD